MTRRGRSRRLLVRKEGERMVHASAVVRPMARGVVARILSYNNARREVVIYCRSNGFCAYCTYYTIARPRSS